MGSTFHNSRLSVGVPSVCNTVNGALNGVDFADDYVLEFVDDSVLPLQRHPVEDGVVDDEVRCHRKGWLGSGNVSSVRPAFIRNQSANRGDERINFFVGHELFHWERELRFGFFGPDFRSEELADVSRLDCLSDEGACGGAVSSEVYWTVTEDGLSVSGVEGDVAVPRVLIHTEPEFR